MGYLGFQFGRTSGNEDKSSDYQNGPKKPKSMSFIKIGLLVVVVFLLGIMLISSTYTVKETEQALVTTFGKLTNVTSAGFHFKLPWPIQSVTKEEVNRTQKITIGYREENPNENIISESKMITGDYNIVNFDFFLEWKISDGYKYVYSSDNPEEILKMIAQASARSVISSKTVDEVLTTGKPVIQAEIKDKIQEKLAHYDIGVQVLSVKIQDSEPPTDDIKMAIKEVETAKQEKETAINKALAYANKALPDAQSKADKLLREAESYKTSRINEAKGQVAKFNAMYDEYIKFKDITKTRMYLETIEDILPGVTVYIDTTGTGDINKMLPLKEFAAGGAEQ